MRACIPLDTWFFISTALQQQLQENYLHAQLCCRLISYPISESCHIHFMMVIKRSCRSLLLFGCRDAETWYCLHDLRPITLNQSQAPATRGHCPMASSAPWDRSRKQGGGLGTSSTLGFNCCPLARILTLLLLQRGRSATQGASPCGLHAWLQGPAHQAAPRSYSSCPGLRTRVGGGLRQGPQVTSCASRSPALMSLLCLGFHSRSG